MISDTLDERGKNYGVYTKVSIVSQNLKDILRSGASWFTMEPYMRESLDMICNKLSRIANGNPYYDDSWHDIAGYATLVEDEINKGK
jgi:hypothetical protein